jgi:hypothetical protein
MLFYDTVTLFADPARPRPALILAAHIDLCPEILSRQFSQMLLKVPPCVSEAFAALAPAKGGNLAAAAFAERIAIHGLSGG